MGGAFRRWQVVLTLLVTLGTGTTHAVAQITEGGSPNPPGIGGGTTTPPVLPGQAPQTLPPPPGGAFGFPSPFAPPNAVNNDIPPVAPDQIQTPVSLGLPPVGYGITPLQAYDPNAPALLIQPLVTVGELFTDNVNQTSSKRTAAAETRLIPGLSVSADTPRFQGVFTGQVEGDVYAPTSNLDQIFANLYLSGVGTVVPGQLFVNLQSIVTQASALPGVGFRNVSQLPRNQQTQVYANTISPFLRESFDGLVDTELRYRLGTTNYGGTTQVAATPGSASLANLSNGVLNEGTLTIATGRDFQRALSRLTVDAQNFNTSSTSRNSQVSAFDDLEYRIMPAIAALARAGYQNIQFPFAPGATFTGPTWLVGGRVGLLGPDPNYVALEYGVQQGVYGFTGSARYNITPTLLFNATLTQGIYAPTEAFATALATSTLDPYGSIVDQYSGLPTAFYNPGLGLTNGVYRQHLFTAGLTDVIGANRYSLYGYYNNQVSLTPPTTGPTKTYGLNFIWARDIRPDLNSYTSLGYFKSSNVIPIIGGSTTPNTNTNTVNANLGLNYLIANNLTGSVLYSLTYETNGAAVVGGRSGNVVVNQLQFLLSKTF